MAEVPQPPPSPPLAPLPPPEKFPEIGGLIGSEFTVQDSCLEFGVPTFIIEPKDTKEPFKRLASKMGQQGYIPLLRREGQRLMIRVLSKPPVKPSKIQFNILLFLLTLGTVFYSGYWLGSFTVLSKYLMLGDPLVTASLYAVALFAIIGLHECGHKIASEWHDVESSMPYFLPGIPPYGTFGAVILQKEPPVNRDQLFDLGFSGPLTGFIVTVVVAVIGLNLSFQIPEAQLELWQSMFPEAGYIPLPLLFSFLVEVPEGYGVYLHPVAFAAWLGAVITFLQLMPVWQLDGGHIARAVLGPKGHGSASITGLILLILTGWWLMAFMLMFLMRGRHPGPLDDVSPLTPSRKLMSIVMLIILILCVVILPLSS